MYLDFYIVGPFFQHSKFRDCRPRVIQIKIFKGNILAVVNENRSHHSVNQHQ